MFRAFWQIKSCSPVLAAEQRGSVGGGSKAWADRKGDSGILNHQFGHSALQGVAGPVVVVPAQEPASEGGWLEALLDFDNGCPAVSVCRVCLDVTDRWERSGKAYISTY